MELLLVTSRDTQRWVVPKGWPISGMKPHEAAAQEAYEEAGAVGKASPQAVGTYEYRKRRETSSAVCRVELFALPVRRLEASWPEQEERTRRWFALKDAARTVNEPGLAALIRSFVPGKQTS